MMNLYTESRQIAQEAIDQIGLNRDECLDFIYQSCDGHECSIYYHKAIDFCANQNTDDGEQWLEDCGGIAQPGDSFGQIACRIAFATLLVASQEALEELLEEMESE